MDRSAQEAGSLCETRRKNFPVGSTAASLGFGILRRPTSCIRAVVPPTVSHKLPASWADSYNEFRNLRWKQQRTQREG